MMLHQIRENFNTVQLSTLVGLLPTLIIEGSVSTVSIRLLDLITLSKIQLTLPLSSKAGLNQEI